MKPLVLILALLFISCSKEVPQSYNVEGSNLSLTSTGGITHSDPIYDFEYKGHTYLGTIVDGGISIGGHAAHCKCNINKQEVVKIKIDTIQDTIKVKREVIKFN